MISLFCTATQRRAWRLCSKAAFMLYWFKKRYLALPGLLEPAFLPGSGWQIHHNKVQRPEETAHWRNEPAAARRSPAADKEKQWFGHWLPMLPEHHSSHPVVSFPFCFSGKDVTSHLRFSWASWPAHPFLISYCFQSIRHMQPRLIFLKSKAWIMPFLCQETLKDYLSWKIKSKCLDSHSRPSVSIFLPNFISNSPIIYLLNPMLQSTCYSLNVAYLSCSLGIYNLIKEIIQKQK